MILLGWITIARRRLFAAALASLCLLHSTDGDATQRQALVLALPAQGNVFMLAGPLTNSAVQVGPEGALVVDTQVKAVSEVLAESISQISAGPIRFIVSTSASEDHTGGTENLSRHARVGIARAGQRSRAAARPAIVAHENVLARMREADVPEGRWPTETFSGMSRQIYFNGEAITLMHQPAAITDGDTVVVFRGSNVIATGDVFTPGRYPRIELAAGGSINGVIAALNAILTASAPTTARAAPTVILPGRGQLSGTSEVVEYRDAMTIIRDRIHDMVAKGMTLEQVKASGPTSSFDRIYATQAYPGEMFAETVFRSLTQRAESLR